MCQKHVLFLSEAGVEPVPACGSKSGKAKLNDGGVGVCIANSTEAKGLKQHKGKIKMGIKGKNDKMVVLACEDCKERNYTTTKNKKNIKERLELSKYCPTCKKHTNHKETK